MGSTPTPEWIERVARAIWEADAAEYPMTARDWEHAKLIGLQAAYMHAAEVAFDYLLWSSAGTVEGDPLSEPWAEAYWRDRAPSPEQPFPESGRSEVGE